LASAGPFGSGSGRAGLQPGPSAQDGTNEAPPSLLASISLAKVTASDRAAFDQLGWSVAVDGDTAVVGAPFDETAAGFDAGSAYVFVRSGTAWTQQAKLTPSAGADFEDHFGFSVAVDGDTAVVGAPLDGTAGFRAGAAYVFVRSGTTWSQQAKLTAADAADNDNFGQSVAVAGDTAVVGAPADTTPAGTQAGSAYVFVRSGTAWTQQAKLTAFDGAAFDNFGLSVAVAGDTAVVGRPSDETAPGFNTGSAYVFVRSGTAWTQQAKLTASDGAAFDQLGWSVALAGDTAVVGAPFDDTAAEDAGSAYVFVRSGTAWTQQAKLTASDGAAFDNFGRSVAVAGDRAVVGAPFDDTPRGSSAGSAYAFVRSGTTWTQRAKATAPDGAAGDQFGYSVALTATAAVAGAPGDNTPAGSDTGSAYIYFA
jgi:hypothetical protein